MKINTKWVSAVAALALSASVAVAATQAGEGHRGRGEFDGARHERGERGGFDIANKLNLTDAQKQQWQDVRKASREANKAFFEQAHATMEQFRAAKEAGDTAKAESLRPTVEAQRQQLQQIRQADEQKLVAILTPEQRAQFDAMKAERAARRAEHGKAGAQR